MGFQCTAFSKMGIYTVKRSLISAIILGGLMVSAQAADLSADSVKDAMPAIPDGPITWHGVTFYGTVDVGYAYSEHGAPISGAFYNGADTTIFGSPFANRSISTLNNNALSLSNVGLKIEEQIGYGFLAVGKLETQFNPVSGELGDACASLIRNNGLLVTQVATNNADGSRCGQAFANAAYAGLSSPIYGTLTVGRQTSLVNDGMGSYDPMALSPAFSLIGYSGTAGGGVGSTEATRWDNSVKYLLTYGPVHAAGMYTNGGQDTPIVNDAWGANVGVNTKKMALLIWHASALPHQLATPPALVTACDAFIGNCPNYLLGTITNNEAWDVMAKYTFNVPGFFGAPEVSLKDAPCGGLKDAPCAPPSAKVTISGGYQHVDQSNPDHPQAFYSGNTTIGGYKYVTTLNPLLQAFGTDRIRETAWAGVRYEDGPWALVGAYYFFSQNSFLNASNQNCTQATNAIAATALGAHIGSNCSGDFNQGSFLIDYTFNRHLDIYAGVTFTDQTGGLNSGFLQNSDVAVATGVRVKW